MKLLSLALLLCSQSLFAVEGFYYTTGTVEVYKNELTKKSAKLLKIKVRLDSDRRTQCLLTLEGPQTAESFYGIKDLGSNCSMSGTEFVGFFQRQGIELNEISKDQVWMRTGENCRDGFWANRCKNSIEYKTSNPHVTYTVKTDIYHWKKL